LAALAGQLVPHPGVLLLALKQLVTSGLPLLTVDNLVIGHPGFFPFGARSWPLAWRPTDTDQPESRESPRAGLSRVPARPRWSRPRVAGRTRRAGPGSGRQPSARFRSW